MVGESTEFLENEEKESNKRRQLDVIMLVRQLGTQIPN